MNFSKLEMVLQIVDWRHRYATGKLMGGEWCIAEIRYLMSLTKAEVKKAWLHTFSVNS